MSAPPPRSSRIPGPAGRGRTLRGLARDPGGVLPGGRGGRAAPGVRGQGEEQRSRGRDGDLRGRLCLEQGRRRRGDTRVAAPQHLPSGRKLQVELGEAGSFGPAPRAWKGRAEWSFLEEQRKSCPFLVVDEASPGGEWKWPEGSCCPGEGL